MLIGGNMGNREDFLQRTREALAALGTIRASSFVWETEAWGKTDQPSFLNQAIALQTDLPPSELLRSILQIEERLGRRRDERYGPRTTDIDILFYESEIIELPYLQVPHPQLEHRRFALQCLHDIAPQLVHPVNGKTVQQLLTECPDPLTVHKFN